MWLAMVVLVLAVAGAGATSPALRCPADAAEDQCFPETSTAFRLNGSFVEISYEMDNSVILECDDSGLQLDTAQASRWLPRYTPALRVGSVAVSNCPPAHYAAVLAAVNVTPTSPFSLELGYTEYNRPLTAAHFADLPPLRHLTLRDAGVLHSLPASLEGLTMLTMEDVKLLDDTILKALPRTLTELRLEKVNITRVPAAVLELPELRSLQVDFLPNVVGVVERGTAPRLQLLHVGGADAALMSEWAPPVLEEVGLEYSRPETLNPLLACDKLIKLSLCFWSPSSLPAGWVARCPRLEELHINAMMNTLEVPASLLRNATHLTSLSIQDARLTSLPAQLFADTPHLTQLDLSINQLYELPSSMLTLRLLSLDLRSNLFNASVAAELATFTELRNLSLVWNKRLGDLCSVNDSNDIEYKMKSSLAPLSKLERLNLQETNVSMICSDWREVMVDLKYLDLSHTNIRNLTYEDLQYKRNVPAVVELEGTVYFTADDYDRAAAVAAVAPPSRYVTLMLRSHLFYNCSLYWLKEALNNNILPLRDVQLSDDSSLRTVVVENLLCPRKEMCETVPAGCDCGMAGDGLLRVVCVGLELDRVLSLQALADDIDAVDVVFINNSITELVFKDLPQHLRVLDLRNNSISYMTEATARALVSGTKRRVLLAGNRLDCSCRATPALRVLRDHAAVLVGYAALRCEDGGTLQDAVDACWTLTSIVVTALLPTVTAATLALWLRWRWRFVLGHVRALLWRLGWSPSGERDATAGAWTSDAFVMFGRGDEAPALEVTARLERGPRPRRVCLAERDWLPPARLSECIVESARAARRTVALVSRECELLLDTDEVHATARRGALVLVLPPAGEPEDAALRRYATDYPHMVLRRDAPGFWRRLERAVPPPPAPPHPPDYIPLVPLAPHR